ncbi:MAG: 23S rRNA (adenine(2503)-C(2))-methyltransferase RlmN [Chloroflexota bacterium]|nr:23S rRNA (adenine(2503)-C(2))-methyltransferase RlmN [Chloroflexota bacterium]
MRQARPRAERPLGLYDFTLPELTAKLETMGQPAYRARQLYAWLYQRLAAGYDEMSSLPAALRVELTATLPLTTLTHVRDRAADADQTIKTLYRTGDGELVETVLMLYPDRATVCVSCQVGCAVGCAFCATGLGGLARNLSAGEMVAQVVGAARRARAVGRPLTNVVMMGMGEPFQNYAATMKFVGIINDAAGLNLGARRITISTSGVVPRIDALADEPYQVNLAVSLHAPTDELRDQLVPLNKRYPIADLMAACERYVARTRRRISFEYALMRGINDSDEVARQLGNLLRGLQMRCHVNVIPLNPVDVLPYERPDPAAIERFAASLRQAGIATTVRYSRGVEIGAACGQLRAREHPLANGSAVPAATGDAAAPGAAAHHGASTPTAVAGK